MTVDEARVIELHHADCRDILPKLKDCSVDALVTDPPAGIAFMGQSWDRFQRDKFIRFLTDILEQCLRVLKPGAHALVWAIPRTSHWTATALEDAGFEIRDVVVHLQGSGFPKSRNVSEDLAEIRCRCEEAGSDLRDVRAAVSTQESQGTEQGSVLHSDLLRGVAVGDSARAHASDRAARSGGLDGGEPAVVSVEDEREREPGVEGRRDLATPEGPLRSGALCPLPGAVHGDGARGRVRDGAPAGDGATPRPGADENGSGASQGPQPAEQRVAEPGALAGQPFAQAGGAWPLCDRCGKSRIPGGLGTALKPGAEHWILARKPLSEKSVAANVLRWGTGAINIDGCRIAHADAADLATLQAKNPGRDDKVTSGVYGAGRPQQSVNASGRWPANVVLSHSLFCKLVGTREVERPILESHGQDTPGKSTYGSNGPGGGSNRKGVAMETVEVWDCAPDCAVAALDAQSGAVRSSGVYAKGSRVQGLKDGPASIPIDGTTSASYDDRGGASRFFYVAKAGRKERDAGLGDDLFSGEGVEPREGGVRSETSGQHLTRRDGGDPGLVRNAHPTVKPLELMRYLCRLVTPPGGQILDPFMGSGTTGIAAGLEGFGFIGITEDERDVEVARRRIAHWTGA